MAKDNKKAAAAAAEEQKNAQVANESTQAQVINDNDIDNIENEIREGGLIEENLSKEVDEMIKKEKDDLKKRELKEIRLESEYIKKREVLALRHERADAKARKEAVTKLDEAHKAVSTGKMTPNEFEKTVTEIINERQKAFDENRKKENELVQELKRQFPNSYNCEWEYERWTAGTPRRRYSW